MSKLKLDEKQKVFISEPKTDEYGEYIKSDIIQKIEDAWKVRDLNERRDMIMEALIDASKIERGHLRVKVGHLTCELYVGKTPSQDEEIIKRFMEAMYLQIIENIAEFGFDDFLTKAIEND